VPSTHMRCSKTASLRATATTATLGPHQSHATHFQMRQLKNVRAEMALHVLAYNIKRMINIMGIGSLIRAIAA